MACSPRHLNWFKIFKVSFLRSWEILQRRWPLITGVCWHPSRSVRVSVSRLAPFGLWVGLPYALWVWRRSFFHSLFSSSPWCLLASESFSSSPSSPCIRLFSVPYEERAGSEVSCELEKMTVVQMGPGIHVFISEQLTRRCCLLCCFHCIVVSKYMELPSCSSPRLTDCRTCQCFKGVLRIS